MNVYFNEVLLKYEKNDRDANNFGVNCMVHGFMLIINLPNCAPFLQCCSSFHSEKKFISGLARAIIILFFDTIIIYFDSNSTCLQLTHAM